MQSESKRDRGAVSTQPIFAVGEPFPDILLPSLANGRPLSLAQFRGQKVLLHIFASW